MFQQKREILHPYGSSNLHKDDQVKMYVNFDIKGTKSRKFG